MLRCVVFCLSSAALLVSVSARAEPLPSTAKKATMEEFKAFADGKKVDVVIFDAGVPITAQLVWDWKKKRITGSALINDKDEIKVKTKLSFKDQQACSEQDGKPVCHDIYIAGDQFFEVRTDGDVHAISTLMK